MSNLNNNTAQLEALLVKVNALPDAGSGSNLTTVPVTIDDNEALADTVIAIYATLDESGNPYVTSATVIKSDWNSGEPINVVTGTPLVIKSGNEECTAGYVDSSGFTSISVTDGVVICHVGTVACEIVPSQIEKSGEDLSEELAAQDELIADIKTAIAGKAGGGGGGGVTPTLVTITICNWTSSTMTARYTGYENGVASPKIGSIISNGELVITVIDQTTLCITSTDSFSCDGRSAGLDYVGGEGGETYAVYVIDTSKQDGETSMAVDFS